MTISLLGNTIMFGALNNSLVGPDSVYVNQNGQLVAITNPSGNNNYRYTTYTSDGTELDSFVIDINTDSGGGLSTSTITDIAVRDDGSFIAHFASGNSGSFVRIFNADGTPQTDFILVDNTGNDHSLAVVGLMLMATVSVRKSIL